MTTRNDIGRGASRHRLLGALAAAGLAFSIAGCGGDDDGDATPATQAADADADADAATQATGAPGADEPTATDEPVATEPVATEVQSTTWDPGDVQMRVVNLLADPVDVYVRTTGLIEAWEAFLGVEPGVVTELVAPPADGALIVTTAGAGDPECVVTCPHFLAEITANDSAGPVHTVILHETDGTPSNFDAWESAPEEWKGNANAMPDPDPAMGLVVVSAVDVVGADFGMRLGFADGAGCVEPVNLSNVLVGGNQTPAFAYPDPTAEVLLFDNNDRECAGPAVGGPFAVAGGPGTRTLLILTGEPNALEAIVLPLVGDEDAAAEAAAGGGATTGTSVAGGDGDSAAPSAERDLAVELMAVEVQSGLGVPAEQSACVAGLLVDAIGLDVLLVDGELIDLDTLPDTYEAPATEALIASVDVCGVDPTLFGEG